MINFNFRENKFIEKIEKLRGEEKGKIMKVVNIYLI
jgi:hypothetical protein